ncbi:putative Phosphatidate phosphatase LPIN [Babesia divergens]|uniref:phosphatidate phosphatase n=1 Tax=Babesia divergens TaxID=32595 RepID=A0AAD9G949_BABDI|nr:putative Phosphatidate phosphatase LPIN [Babesia divergens]
MWEKLYSSVVNVLDINQATLSGCVDIICVRHKEVVDDGMVVERSGAGSSVDTSELRENERWVYRSTPFHVRFGKTKLLKSREKTVSIYVNGELSSLTMKLGAAGEAFFGEETCNDGPSSAMNFSGASFSRDSSEVSDCSDDGEEAARPIMDYGYYACSTGGRITVSDQGEKRTSLASLDSRRSDVVQGSTRSTSSKVINQTSEAPSYRTTEEFNASHQQYSTKSGNAGMHGSSAMMESGHGSDSAGDHQWSWNDLRMKSGDYKESDDQILQFSLCGHLLSAQDEELNKQFFQANLVDWERLNADPSLWYHPSLVARFDNRPPYYPSKIALPLLASWIVFNKPLSGEAIGSLLRMMVVATNPSPSPPLANSLAFNRNKSASTEYRKDRILRRYRLSIRPTSDQLASLNLKMGANNIRFTVSSPWQGTKSVTATLYLWPSDSKIVISDVDGTITRSDALGHIMPILGRDWSHTGVAELFTKIRDNGYQVVYLTARAIGQAEYTREYLFGLTQKEKDKLPRGPLFLSPDRLLPSFKREVISRSAYMFKIPALRDIRNLFPPDHNPFCAGFGNNESDHRAYVSVGIPENRVFIINSSGIIRHVNTSYAKTYESMSEIAAHMFPPCNASGIGGHQGPIYQ